MGEVMGEISDSSDEAYVDRSRLSRFLWTAAGTFLLVLGLIAVFLPVLPTTPFLLLAVACYLRGSKRMYEWLMNNRVLGPYIKNYREGRGIPIKLKLFTITLLWLSIGFTAFVVINDPLVQIALIAIAMAVSIHIAMMRTLRERPQLP